MDIGVISDGWLGWCDVDAWAWTLDGTDSATSDYWTLFMMLGWIQGGFLRRLTSLRGGRRYVVGFNKSILNPPIKWWRSGLISTASRVCVVYGTLAPHTVSTPLSLFSLVRSSMLASDLRYILYAFLHHSPFHSLMCPCVDGMLHHCSDHWFHPQPPPWVALQIDHFYLHSLEIFLAYSCVSRYQKPWVYLHCWSTDSGRGTSSLSLARISVRSNLCLFHFLRKGDEWSWCASLQLFICRRHCPWTYFPTTCKSTVCVLFGPSLIGIVGRGDQLSKKGNIRHSGLKVHYSRSLSSATSANHIYLHS
jgi:hypothetical protein